MDVGIGVLGTVELNDPVDGREVETSSGDVGGEEAAGGRGGETVEDVESLGLLLFAVEFEERDSWVEFAEGLVDESNLEEGKERRI